MGITDRNETTTSPSGLIWEAAGRPPHKYAEEAYAGPCATCGTPCEVGVSTEEINNPTFSNHAEFFRYGTHVCRACAWLYGDPKRTHRNVLAVGDRLWWPMISVESATEERPSWLGLLRRVSKMPPEAPVAGVLTSDPKPRNWPRMQAATVRSFGLYVYAPDYDTSVFRRVELASVLAAVEPMLEALRRGFSKQRIYSGLLADYAKTKKGMEGVMQLEEELRQLRYAPEFVPALLVSGVKKEDRGNERATVAGEPERAGEARDKTHKDGDRLF